MFARERPRHIEGAGESTALLGAITPQSSLHFSILCEFGAWAQMHWCVFQAASPGLESCSQPRGLWFLQSLDYGAGLFNIMKSHFMLALRSRKLGTKAVFENNTLPKLGFPCNYVLSYASSNW